jgi:Na+-transporting NADH:ubiquinone oxidoreductase subunit C
MAKNTDSNLYTVLFATGMVIVVGALLSFLAASLKDKIAENKRIEKQQNILYAMGVNENDETSVEFVAKEKVEAEFSKYISKQLVFEGEKVSENDQAYLIDLKRESARQKAGEVRRLPLFIGQKDGQKLYIVPVRGKGLWDAIWGYVALTEDLVVNGVYFDHKGETPGLGSNIKERFFMDDFKGEHIIDSNGNFKGIAVAKGNADPKNLDKKDFEVDAIAGSTITGDGLAMMLKKDLKMYIPHLKKLKQ